MTICEHCNSDFKKVGIYEASADEYVKESWINIVKEHLFKNLESDYDPLEITFFSLCGKCKQPNFVGLGGSEEDFDDNHQEEY